MGVLCFYIRKDSGRYQETFSSSPWICTPLRISLDLRIWKQILQGQNKIILFGEDIGVTSCAPSQKTASRLLLCINPLLGIDT
ncbi:hypothetical protein FKM82_017489 [Ascaphus truei]